MLIGKLADATGVTRQTLRFYERERLLHEPARTRGGYRDYHPAAVDRIRFIKQAQAAGLTLRQIKEVLDVRDEGRAPCQHVAGLVATTLAEIERRQRELAAIRAQLLEIRSRLEQLDPADCEAERICVAVQREPALRHRQDAFATPS